MRKKTGNLVVALCMLAISLIFIILSYFFGPIKEGRTMLETLLNKNISNFGDIFKNFSFARVSKFYVIAYILPVLSSILAIIFKRRRIANIFNVFSWTVAICIFLLPLRLYSSTNSIPLVRVVTEYTTIPYMIMLSLTGVAFIGSVVNTQLCR